MRSITLEKWIITLVIVVILLPSGAAVTEEIHGLPQVIREELPELPAESYNYLPLVVAPYLGVELIDAWIGNQDGIALSTFLPGAPLEYIISGSNTGSTVDTVDLRWSQTGSCGSTQVFTKTLEIDPGLWVDVEPAISPDCIGVFTATAQITGTNYTSAQSVNFRVNTASVVISDKQAFDRCNMPSIPEMQTWWDASPYYVANVYLGGISYDNTTGCSNDNIDVNWMQSVADQGWSFLLAWVGPQAPCSGYTDKMSYDSAVSYQQGRDEAAMAVQAAADIGLASSIIIYYDVEGYGNTNNSACRAAVGSFLQGWTEQLHAMGAKSGAYGSPCNSHITDWADIVSPPDDVWIAHWLGNEYDPDATVWDVACLSNDLWPYHQRVRQYAGDHIETWGGLSLHIDSNVLDGEVVALSATDTVTTTVVTSLEENLLQLTPPLRDLGLLSPDQGWVLADDRLIMTQDGGARWYDLTPQEVDKILDVQFLDAVNGLLIHKNEYGIMLLSTSDGGASWQPIRLPAANGEIVAASLDFLDLSTGRLTLKLPSGSTFNLTSRLSTRDGGQTWHGGETLLLPTDEHIPGILSGDGNLPEGTVLLDWVDENSAWALAQHGTCQGTKMQVGAETSIDADPWQCDLQTHLWKTMDGGQTWMDITPK